MDKYPKKELEEALQIISLIISRCEKTQPKFVEGTSQHTLLKNRIKAMYISKSLIADDNSVENYTKEELIEALRPVSSIISKCEKAQQKFAEDTSHHTRFKNMINAMSLSKSLITDKVDKIPDWKVYYDGNFWGHHGRESAGKEISLGKQFVWDDEVCLIPSIYTSNKGLIVDFCLKVPAERIRYFMEKWNLSI